jgi:hypothetical protein
MEALPKNPKFLFESQAIFSKTFYLLDQFLLIPK